MRTFAFVSTLAATAHGFGTLCGQSDVPEQWPAPTEMPANLRVALIGDQGNGSTPKRVLEMIKEWDAEFIIHDGDFEYKDNPTLFISQIDEVLGADYPYFTSIGNHDVKAWTGSSGYESLLVRRGENWNQTSYCTGEMSVNQACYYKGLYFVLSGVGTRGSNHVKYIDDAFNAYAGADHPWKLCSWHKNQRLMQIGGKSDETGWAVYDMCREHGAIISTGHEHSYCRSYLMSDIERQNIVNTNNDIVLTEGESFVHVTGLGGKSIRSTQSNRHKNPWWAAWGASDNKVKDGALLCTFNVDGRLNEAECEYRDYNGKQWDQFKMTSNLQGKVNKAATQSILNNECNSRFVEVPITLAEDDREVQASGEGDALFNRVHGKFGSVSLFTFHDLPFTSEDLSRLQWANLQLMGAEEGVESVEVPVTITSTVEESPVVDWTHTLEGWEKHEVWVSPDLTSVVQHAFRDDEPLTLALQVDVAGARQFYSKDESDCLSPTLALEFAPKKDC